MAVVSGGVRRVPFHRIRTERDTGGFSSSAGAFWISCPRARTQVLDSGCTAGILLAMAAKDELGRHGEDLAVAYLEGEGLRIVERNWRCEHGEIDIIATEGDTTVFVEVKTRTSTAFGHPLEAITLQKLARLRRLAAAWCEAHPAMRRSIRLDAVAVLAPRGPAATVEHVRALI
jgi:putative endonuclease